MIIVPAKDQFGTSTVTVRATDGDNMTGNRSFKVTVRKPNNLPTITSISNQTINQGGSTGALPVTIGDVETATGFLQLSATSSNPTLAPSGNVTFGGSKANRTVTVTPVATESGTSVITVTVSDTDGGTASTAFVLTVKGETDNPPTISSIADQTTNQDEPTGVISFTIDDDKTAKGFLVLSKESSNTALVPLDGIVLGGSAGNRTVFVTPALGQSGVANITITVKDGKNQTASTSFKVTVNKAKTTIANDFNGDGKPDLILQDDSGFLGVWRMNKESLVSAALLTPNNSGDSNWRVVGSGDFNGDGNTDLLFQHSDSTVAVWYMSGESMTSPTLVDPAGPGAGWRVVGAADFDGDGKSDILFQTNDRILAVWKMDGVILTTPSTINPADAGEGWNAVAIADLNNDGNPDIVLQHDDGTLAAWKLNGLDLSSAVLLDPSAPGTWKVVSALDLDQDGNVDLILHNPVDGSLAVWYMNGTKLVNAKYLNPQSASGTWQVVAP